MQAPWDRVVVAKPSKKSVKKPVPVKKPAAKAAAAKSAAVKKAPAKTKAAKPDPRARAKELSKLEKFKAAMLAAKSVVHANPTATPSGGHLARVWEQLGIAEAMKGKLLFRNALDGGVAAITKGEAEIGLYPLSEIIAEKGVTVVGLIPGEVQLNTFYGAAVLSANPAPEPAAAFVRFLADPKHAGVWKHAGFDPAK